MIVINTFEFRFGCMIVTLQFELFVRDGGGQRDNDDERSGGEIECFKRGADRRSHESACE
jgi:hypothetical protein